MDEPILEGVREIAKAKAIEFKKELYEKDIRYIKAYTRAFIGRRLWGNEGWSRVMLQEDAQFKKALNLFPEAEQFKRLQILRDYDRRTRGVLNRLWVEIKVR